jgi:hypothetical protein
MKEPSRIELARRRLSIARRAIGVAAAAGFVVFALAARASHPGISASTSQSTSSSVATEATSSDDDDYGGDDNSTSGFDFGQGSIAPSTGGSTLQSGGS